jgi:hypothetical protein
MLRVFGMSGEERPKCGGMMARGRGLSICTEIQGTIVALKQSLDKSV